MQQPARLSWPSASTADIGFGVPPLNHQRLHPYLHHHHMLHMPSVVHQYHRHQHQPHHLHPHYPPHLTTSGIALSNRATAHLRRCCGEATAVQPLNHISGMPPPVLESAASAANYGGTQQLVYLPIAVAPSITSSMSTVLMPGLGRPSLPEIPAIDIRQAVQHQAITAPLPVNHPPQQPSPIETSQVCAVCASACVCVYKYKYTIYVKVLRLSRVI